MTERDLPKPLDTDVRSALASERTRPGPSAGVRARSFARLQAALGAPGGGGGDEGAAGSAPSPDLAAPDLTPVAPAEGAPVVATTVLRAHPGLVGGTGFFLGALAGAALHAAVATGPAPLPSPPAVATAAVARTPAASVVVTVSPPLPSAAPAVVSTVTSSAVAAAAAPSAGSTLTAERALLDVARAAIARGEPAAATSALNQHQSRFPRGVFREEREALFIQTLRDTGRLGEARQRALAFRARYPKSLFLSTVERVLESNP